MTDIKSNIERKAEINESGRTTRRTLEHTTSQISNHGQPTKCPSLHGTQLDSDLNRMLSTAKLMSEVGTHCFNHTVFLTYTSLPSVPSSAPVITQLVSTSHNITVSWKSIKKSKRNGIIRGYHLEAVSINTRSPIVRLTTKLQPTVFTHTFTHLHPFTKFNISVAAYTSRGRGPSSYSLATTEQARMTRI